MLPYQPVAMDFAGYQRQQTPGHPGSHMTPMSSLGMPTVGGGPFTHSWLVPTQDLCAVPYNKMPNHHHHQHQGQHQPQPLEPGFVFFVTKFLNIFFFTKTEFGKRNLCQIFNNDKM